MAYTWIPFYKELAQKLFRFSRNRTPLVNWIYDNLDGNIGHLKDAPDGQIKHKDGNTIYFRTLDLNTDFDTIRKRLDSFVR